MLHNENYYTQGNGQKRFEFINYAITVNHKFTFQYGISDFSINFHITQYSV